MPQPRTIRVEEPAEGVALVTFDRPETRNALDEQMVDELRSALRELAAAPGTRAVVFTGAGGKAFISGADIAELRERRSADALRRINNGLFREIEAFPHPTIAAIRGYALGGGCELAMACDLRVCGASAVLGQPEVALGIIPGAGATYRLPRLVGLGMARELIFTGRRVDATEAKAIGLVNRVVPDDDVVAEALRLAAAIAANSGLAVRFAKMALNHHHEMSIDAAMAFEANAQAVLFDDDEKLRRMTEFLERRERKAKAKDQEPPT
jgi:enoyl-CoA hydratase